MSLPMYGHDHGRGESFGPPGTTSRQRNFASGSGANWTTGTTGVPSLPRRQKQKKKYQEPSKKTDWELDNSTPLHQNTDTRRDSNNTQQLRRNGQSPAGGYGRRNTYGSAKPKYNNRETYYEDDDSDDEYPPWFIKMWPGFCYDGTNFSEFLVQYEQAARVVGASDYHKALQIGRFVKIEELKCEIESMDGYEECNWRKLRASMFQSWAVFEDFISTKKDLVNLVKDFSRNREKISYEEFKTHHENFSKILDYLIDTGQVQEKQEASLLFISSFPPKIQENIQLNLIQYGQLPT